MKKMGNNELQVAENFEGAGLAKINRIYIHIVAGRVSRLAVESY